MSEIDDGFAPPLPMDDEKTTIITGADSDAPYGRFKNGKPRKNPPKGVSAPRSKSTYKTKTKTDYRPGFLGLAQLGAFAAGFFSPLDAVSITDHAPNIAEAVQVTADNDPKFAAAMDRILSAGPYAALLSACIPLAIQIVHNHSDAVTVEMVKGMGGRSRDEIIAQLTQAA
jgi:hypothetical protein